jgi:hypothetical protein
VEQPVYVDIALAAFAGRDLELKIRISCGSRADVLDSGGRERGASQIGMEDYAGCVDHRPQRVPKRLAQLALHSTGQAGQGQRHSILIKAPTRDLFPQAGEHFAGGVGDGSLAFPGDKR